MRPPEKHLNIAATRGFVKEIGLGNVHPLFSLSRQNHYSVILSRTLTYDDKNNDCRAFSDKNVTPFNNGEGKIRDINKIIQFSLWWNQRFIVTNVNIEIIMQSIVAQGQPRLKIVNVVQVSMSLQQNRGNVELCMNMDF